LITLLDTQIAIFGVFQLRDHWGLQVVGRLNVTTVGVMEDVDLGIGVPTFALCVFVWEDKKF